MSREWAERVRDIITAHLKRDPINASVQPQDCYYTRDWASLVCIYAQVQQIRATSKLINQIKATRRARGGRVGEIDLSIKPCLVTPGTCTFIVNVEIRYWVWIRELLLLLLLAMLVVLLANSITIGRHVRLMNGI